MTDHAGTPQELCSENGEVVWQGEQALWGHYQQQNALPNHGFRENAHNDELYCDLRYQGQIEDRESGLYYNVNRYYDADSGQYLSPDPIGFAGGLRPQAYVFNPLEWVDPLGLTSCELAKKMGDSGGLRPKNSAAHHIVGETSKGAKPARDILKKHNIDINGAENGVFLPNRNNQDNMPGILHNGRHPDAYLDAVNKKIVLVDELGGKQGVTNALSDMRNTLLSADRNASWYTIIK